MRTHTDSHCYSASHEAAEFCPGCESKPELVSCFGCGDDLRSPVLCHECAEGYDNDGDSKTPRKAADFSCEEFAHMAVKIPKGRR